MRLLFAGFEKIETQDDGTLIVKGVASSEREDSDGEIIKADAVRAAIPDYMQFGAVREMHQNIAAGTAVAMSVDDEGLTHLEAHIVDPVTVQKIDAKVLKGFSLGGKITKRDSKNKKIITGIALTEISCVDRPANPDALYELVKLDGHGQMLKVAARADASPKEGESKYGDVAFADPKNKKYPIDTESHIRAAWNYINKPKNAGKYSSADVASIKRRTLAAWKKKIDAAGPPSAESEKQKFAEATALAKGMGTVARLAWLIQELASVQAETSYERSYEGDESEIPEDLASRAAELCGTLDAMLDEESRELIAQMTAPTAAHDALTAGAAMKADDITDLAKAKSVIAGMRTTADRLHKMAEGALDACTKLHKATGDHVAAFGQDGDATDKAEDAAAIAKTAADKAEAEKREAAKAAGAGATLEGRFAKLEKDLADEREARVKAERQTADLVDAVGEFVKRETPAPAEPAKRPALRAVGKADDVVDATKAAVVDEKDPLALIKQSHAHPMDERRTA